MVDAYVPPEVLRFRWTKVGKVRFLSHRDTARVWERAAKRIELPVARSGGFTPRPKIGFGLALPTGAESYAEYLDVEIARDVPLPDLNALPASLSAALPVGVDVSAVGRLEPRTPSLQRSVTTCDWAVVVHGLTPEVAQQRIDDVLAASSLPAVITRKGTEVEEDLRPAVVAVTAVSEPVLGDAPMIATRIVMTLANAAALVAEGEGAAKTARPGDITAALFPGLATGVLRRTHQWIAIADERHEPLLLPLWAQPLEPAAVGATYAQARAS